MANPTAPGVYIQEISTLPPSIAPVATAVPAFIGYTETGTSATAMTPVRITSMVEYESIFGGPPQETFDVTLSTASVSIAVVRTTLPDNQGMVLYYQMQMYFGNGGGPCYVASIGNYGDTLDKADMIDGIDKCAEIDEITLLLVPDAINLSSAADRGDVNNAMLTQCANLQDRFAVMDVLDTGNSNTDAAAFRSSGVSANNLKFGACYYPSLNTVIPIQYADVDVKIVAIDPNLPANVLAFNNLKLDKVLSGPPTPDVALYFRIKTALDIRLKLYPGSAMVGIYSAVDRDRGVWKAPANVGVSLVSSLGVVITDESQSGLNVDATSGKSINAIRKFNGRGILVWGARTLDGNSNEWRYVNVRRLFIFAEESCKKASEFVVFEPNDQNTWIRVKGMISNFLTALWRDGALAGAKPEQAFFVKVGLGETMSPQDILEGKLIVQIGLAAVRPAEFIVLQFEHKLQEA